ncbi:MAG: ribosome maturation factor RimP [Actinomycetes bacterium]
MSVTTERVASLVAPLVEDLDLEVYDVEQAGGTLRVLLDRPGGIDLELIAEATRRISRALDEQEPVSGSYTLEVSSPGLERRLRTTEHFVRAVGSRVAVKTRVEVEGERRFDGTVTSVDAGTVTLATDDGATRTFAVADVDKARTVFEWGPTPKQGGKQGSKQGGSAQQRQAQKQSEAS